MNAIGSHIRHNAKDSPNVSGGIFLGRFEMWIFLRHELYLIRDCYNQSKGRKNQPRIRSCWVGNGVAVGVMTVWRCQGRIEDSIFIFSLVV